jgi:hypothetical protein
MTSLPILLPSGFSSLVKINDAITAGQKIAENTAPQEEVINIAKELDISLREAKTAIKKNPGDAVREGDVLAIKKKLLGIQKEAVICKITGTVTRYERDTGELFIRNSYASLTKEFVSPVDGIVTLCDNNKIVISVNKDVVLGVNATGATGEGEVYIFEESSSANQLFYLDSKAIGKIVVAENLNKESLTKGIALGAVGFIATVITPEDIEYVRQKHSQVPVIQVEQESLKKVTEWKNKKIYLDGQAKSIILLQV